MIGAYYDVVVIGGGINGVGVAQAAAADGFSVLLIEKDSLAAGTSSRSSKLIHGGLRYLESWEFGLVRESLTERALLRRLAPDLVRLRDFYIPVYRETRRRPWLLRSGLSLYCVLSGFRLSARFNTLPRRAWDRLDGLKTDGLNAVFHYRDAQTDDRLLTEAVMHSAQHLGAELVCPARFTGAQLAGQGGKVFFRSGDAEHSCRTAVLVNAGGPWVNQVLDQIEPAPEPVGIDLVQGTHIIVPGTLSQGFYYLESPRDGRAVFVMPWQGQVLVGTTETHFHGDPDQVRPLATETRYLCGVLRHYFTAWKNLRSDQVESAFSGLRVLPADGGHLFHRSRETVLQADRPSADGPPRVLSIYGGKLTTYRRTAAKVIEQIRPGLPARHPIADTAKLELELP